MLKWLRSRSKRRKPTDQELEQGHFFNAWKKAPLKVALSSIPKSAWLWSDLETRRMIQEHGLVVVPANFYSNTPSIADIENSFEYKGGRDHPPYDLGLDNETMRTELKSLMVYGQDFAPPDKATDPEAGVYTWDKTLFPGADALAYYGYVRKLKPKTVLEIGSGFSSLVARMALDANGSGRLHCIEPYPRPFLRDRADIGLTVQAVQEIGSEFFNDMLADGDILFIDSTHTVKAGSDCLHIYLRLLPKIRRNIHVHVHDIHLPFATPQKAMLNRQIHWTEQYLLHAFLLDNPKARIVHGTVYNEWRNPDLMKEWLAGRAGSRGGSFWFEYRGAQAL